jgi:hypothetical protein
MSEHDDRLPTHEMLALGAEVLGPLRGVRLARSTGKVFDMSAGNHMKAVFGP